MTIVATESVSQFFGEVVQQAMRARRTSATEAATTYLVALLADYARPDRRAGEALERPLTLLLEEAVHAPDLAERFTRLRSIGDGVLYGCGFFADHFEARGVSPKYLRGIGTRAYGAASSMLRGGGEGAPDVFAELADRFDAFVDVLEEVSDSTLAMAAESSGGLVKAYERWLKTGSVRLAHALTSHGVVPTRGPRGVVQ